MVALIFVPRGSVDPSASQVAWWKIDEGSGDTLADSEGANTATAVGGWWDTGHNQAWARALHMFERVYVADPFFHDPITICAWVSVDSTNTAKALVVKQNLTNGNASNNEYRLYVTAGNKIGFRAWDSGGTLILDVVGATSISQNVWVHVAGSSGGNGGNGRVYLNGSEDGTAAQSAAMGNTGSAIQFGGRYENTDSTYFVGLMQQVRIFNRALTEAEVAFIYSDLA
jgi:hypothetical protein